MKVSMFERIIIHRKDRLLALIMLIIGGLIYLLYRPRSLVLFSMIDHMGLISHINSLRERTENLAFPPFVIYSLPAGLWTASYLLFLHNCTKNQRRITRLMLSLPLPLSAIGLEFMQLLNWCPGTFDINDLICYVIPIVFFIKSS